MPIAKDIAGKLCDLYEYGSRKLTFVGFWKFKGVNMRLEVGAVREMHWHLSAEWAYVLKGDLRVSTVTADGDVWLDDVVRFLFFFPDRTFFLLCNPLFYLSRQATSGTSLLDNRTLSKRKTPLLKEQSFSSSSITGHFPRTLRSC